MSIVGSILVFLATALPAASRASEVPTATPGTATETVAAAEDLVLSGLIAEALDRNPDIATMRSAVVAARQRPAQARALPDPTVGMMFTNEGWSPSLGTMPDSSLGLTVSQDLPYPGKRRLRGRIAELEADEQAARLERARLSVAASVRRAYFDLLAARAVRDIAVEQGALWEQMEGVARARYGVGQGNQQDILRTQIEVTRVQQLVLGQEAEGEVQLAMLNRLLARPAGSSLSTDSSALRLAEPREAFAASLARARQISPEVRAARTAIDRAQAGVDLARRAFKPDFAVQGGYMNRGGLDPMWQAGVAINLPLARARRRSALAEAEADLAAAVSRLEAVDLQLRFRTQERLAQLDAAGRISTLYTEGVIPQDRMSVEAAVANYQSGRVPFVTVLEAIATMYADRAGHARVLAASQATAAALEEASLEATSGLPAGPVPAGGSTASAASSSTGAMSGMGR